MAFGILAQERHNRLHTDSDDRIEGDGTEFSDCSNGLCQQSFNILKDSRSMAVEMNEFTVEMTKDWDMVVKLEGKNLRAFLRPTLQQAKESKIITGG